MTVDIAQVSTEEGRLSLLVAVDGTSKFAFARPVGRAGKTEAARLLRDLAEAVPRRVHTVLTDNGVKLTARKREARDGRHIFDRVRGEHGIEHRLARANHPWTDGQVERMNRTIKDATVERCHYGSHHELRRHPRLSVEVHNHARGLETLRGPTSRELIHRAWTEEPERFRPDPSRHTAGPYT